MGSSRKNPANSIPNYTQEISGNSTSSLPDNIKESRCRLELIRQNFHRSSKCKMIGRIPEKDIIEKFWLDSVMSKKSESRILYICGTPGTGKTALMNELIPKFRKKSGKNIMVVFKNCIMLEKTSDILHELQSEIYSRQTNGKRGNSFENIKKFCANGRKLVLILDEFDQVSTSLGTLTKIIDLLLIPDIFLIGIANSIDMAVNFFPPSILSQTRTLHFEPYTANRIMEIIIRKFQLGKSEANLISSSAVEYCSRKVASTGDLRKALDIIQLAIDIALIDESATEISVDHILKASEKSLKSSSCDLQHNQIATNLNGKFVLLSIIRFENENPVPTGSSLPYKKATIQNIYDKYSEILEYNPSQVNHLSKDEFAILISDLETFGFISIQKSWKQKSAKFLNHMKKITLMSHLKWSCKAVNSPLRETEVTTELVE